MFPMPFGQAPPPRHGHRVGTPDAAAPPSSSAPPVGGSECPSVFGVGLPIVGSALANLGANYYRDLGRKAGTGIILGVTSPVTDVGCWQPVTSALITPFEQGLRDSLEPFIGRKVVVVGAGVFLVGGLLGWWLRGLRR